MQIKRLTLGDFETNCYILQGPKAGTCVLIDPADNGPEISRKLHALETVPEAILLTHGHYDHILAVPYLQNRWPNLPVYCHPLDCPEEAEERDQGRIYPTVSAFHNLRYCRDGDEIIVGGMLIKVIHTPGHTPGSVSLAVEDALFTGDTLFQDSIGRTDFKGGDERDMARSLSRLTALKGDYRVFPGHGATTTLNAERTHNPYLKSL